MSGVTKWFLSDVFDCDDLDEDVVLKPYIDAESMQLNMRMLFASSPPLLLTNLVFRRIWKLVMRMPAPRHHVHGFLKYTRAHKQEKEQVSVPDIVRYMSEHVPAFKLLYPRMFNDDMIQHELMKARHFLKSSDGVKRDVIDKFAERYLGSSKVVVPGDYVGNVFKVYCSYVTRGTSQLTQQQFHDIVEARNLHDELNEKHAYLTINPYNQYQTRPRVDAGVSQSVYDTVATRIVEDASFYPIQLASSHIVLVNDDDGRHNSVLCCVLKAIHQAKPGENIVVFAPAGANIENDIVSKLDFNIVSYTVPTPTSAFYALIPRGFGRSFTCVTSSCASLPEPLMLHSPMQCNCIHVGGDEEETPDLLQQGYGRYIRVIGRETEPKHLQSLRGKCVLYHVPAHPSRDERFVVKLMGQYMFDTSNVTGSCDAMSVYLDFVSRYCHRNAEKLATLHVNPETSIGERNAVVMIDNRANVLSLIAAQATFMNVDDGNWDVVVMCRPDDAEFYRTRMMTGARIVSMPMQSPTLFSMSKYNEMMKSTVVWDQLKEYNRVVLVQDDGFIIRKDHEALERLLAYDYVGAPWDPKLDFNKWMKDFLHPNYVGNGGLSIRNPKLMLEICQKYPVECRALHVDNMQPEPEDVFFARMCLKLQANVPSFEDAQTFASEEVLCMNSLGFHKVYGYHNTERVTAFFESALQS
jgi:hypothetical protein